MASQDSQVFESYVPVYDAIPEEWEDAQQFLVERLKEIANAVNIREIGFFLDEELLSGKQFIPGVGTSGSSQQFRNVLRKVIDCGSLPNAGVKLVPHGINVDASFTLINLEGAATDPISLNSIGLGHAALTPANSVEVFIAGPNIVLQTGINRSGYTRSFVILEYIQEL